MTEQIPEDVRKAATEVWRENWKRTTVEQIEVAILSERERCAKIAEGFEPFGIPDADFARRRPDEGETAAAEYSRTIAIASAIRSQS